MHNLYRHTQAYRKGLLTSFLRYCKNTRSQSPAWHLLPSSDKKMETSSQNWSFPRDLSLHTFWSWGKAVILAGWLPKRKYNDPCESFTCLVVPHFLPLQEARYVQTSSEGFGYDQWMLLHTDYSLIIIYSINFQNLLPSSHTQDKKNK